MNEPSQLLDPEAPGATSFAHRFPWLGCNMAGGIVCALVGSFFQKQLKGAVELALFIPVVLNLAESVASQSVSLSLHTLHHRQPSRDWVAGRLRGELVTGTLLGLACGGTIAAVALAWLGKAAVAGALLGGIAGGMTVSAMLGFMLPMFLTLARLDPTVAAGPVALACADILTILAYLGLARLLLG